MKRMHVYACANCRVTRLTVEAIDIALLGPCAIMYGAQAQCGGDVKLVGVLMVGDYPDDEYRRAPSAT